MHRESTGHEISSLRKKTKKPRVDDFSDFAEGTDPGLKKDFSEEEVTKEHKKQPQQASNLEDDVVGITEGLKKASRMIAGEKRQKNEAKFAAVAAERKAAAKAKVQAAIEAENENREWEEQKALAEQRIAIEGAIPPAAKAEAGGKMFDSNRKAEMEAKLASEEQARQKNDEETWEGKEWDTKLKVAKENAQVDQEWEAKEWEAKTKIAKEKSFWAALKEKIGFGKRREKK